MLSKKTRLFVPLLFVILLVAITVCVRAGTETFNVGPLEEVVRTVGLSEGDKVSGNITVSGGVGDDIDFYVTDPNGNTILSYDRATQTSFSFTASTTGTYTMHFANKFEIISSKSVTLDYTITKARARALGLAPEVFYLLVIIIVGVILAIVVLALRRKKPATPTQ